MIAVERLNGAPFILNADFIETVESTPDTVIGLKTGRKLVVRNSAEDIVRKTIKYKQLCNQTLTVVRQESAEGVPETAESEQA
jgi:flagellar protein FlbD